jgi:predicted type IV restriction endonuclease
MGEPDLSVELKSETGNPESNQGVVVVTPVSESRIVTTEEELQAYYIIKAIACAILDTERITYRDTQSYFGILCDDNNRRTICRLHFNAKQKYIGIINADKNEEKIPLDNLNEIYKLADQLRATAGLYIKN